MNNRDIQEPKAMNSIKLWGSIVSVSIALIGGVFGFVGYLDNVYATDADVIERLAPITVEIEVIKVAQTEFTLEIRELRKDRLRDTIRKIKKERYSLRQLLESTNPRMIDRERLEDLNIDLSDITDRLRSLSK